MLAHALPKFGTMPRARPTSETIMSTFDFRLPTFALGIALACAVAAAAQAQGYPARPVRVVVPFTPGTGMDIIARNVGPRLSERLGQPVVIDNRPGASGNLGAEL